MAVHPWCDPCLGDEGSPLRRVAREGSQPCGSSGDVLTGPILLGGGGHRALRSWRVASSSPRLIPQRHPFSVYLPTDLQRSEPDHPPARDRCATSNCSTIENPQSPLLNNQGKVVSGTDRAGDQWTITVHGPGSVIVTDATPNDGALDDNIDTIQLVGTSLKETYVTGTVTASPYADVESDSTVLFNKLIDQSGVKSVILNGFNLTQTVTPGGGPNNSNTGIFLYGGVGTLSFNQVLATIDPATGDQPDRHRHRRPEHAAEGQAEHRVRQRLQHRVQPHRRHRAAGHAADHADRRHHRQRRDQRHQLHLDRAADQGRAGRAVPVPDRRHHRPHGGPGHGDQPSERGRLGDQLHGVATAQPFQSSLSGLSHLKTASFGGNADAVGLDVDGPIGKLRFTKGLGNPAGTSPATTSSASPPTGSATRQRPRRRPRHREEDRQGQGRAGQHHRADGAEPQLRPVPRRTGSATYYPQPGNALSSAAIVSSGKIGTVAVKGNLSASEIKSGFDYPSFAAGLQGTRASSMIKNSAFKGDLVSGVVSATYRPGNSVYSAPGSVKGPGSITGNLASKNAIYNNGSTTPLLNTGDGLPRQGQEGLPAAPQQTHAGRQRPGALIASRHHPRPSQHAADRSLATGGGLFRRIAVP